MGTGIRISAHRVSLAAVAASIALLVSACGGSQDGGTHTSGKEKERSEPTSSASPTEEAAPPPSAADLKAMLITIGSSGDAQGDQQNAAEASKFYSGDTASYYSADKDACDVLSGSMMALPQGTPHASTGTMGMGEDPGTKSDGPEEQGLEDLMAGIRLDSVSLSSFEGDGAQDVIDGYRTAVKKCTGGFTTEVTEAGRKHAKEMQVNGGGDNDEPQPIASVSETPVDKGDDAVAWAMKVGEEGAAMPINVVAVRKGPVVVTAATMSFAIGSEGEPPLKTVDAQLAALKSIG